MALPASTSSSRFVPALFAAIAVATALAAQTVTVPALLATGEGGGTTDVWFGPNRYQCIYDSSNFVSQGVGQAITITNLEFRRRGGQLTSIVTFPTVNIYLQKAARDYLSLSATFATNRTVPLPTTPNYSGPVTTVPVPGTMPNGVCISVPLSTPFTYAADDGADLLVEIEIPSAPSPPNFNSVNSAFDAITYGCNCVMSNNSTTSSTGTITPFTPVIRFTYTDSATSARQQLYGTGCVFGAQSFYELFPNGTNDLSGKTVTMTLNASNGYDVVTTTGAVIAPGGVGLPLADDIVSAALNL